MERKRILVADDNRSLRVVLHSALSACYDVTIVADGQALADELSLHPFDLVITDLNLPHCTGSAALRRASQATVGQQRIPIMDIPVLVITGMDRDDEEVAAVQRMVNVQEILFKPLDLSVLRKKVDDLLAESLVEALPRQEVLETCVLNMKKVLVVDDDPDVRDLLSLAFESAGFQVRGAATAAAALELSLKKRFDLVLLDYALEEDIADQVIESLEEQHAGEKLPPILLVTGYAAGLSMERYAGHPEVKGIVAKPFDPEQLVEQACQLLDIKRSDAVECVA
ncbi:MAG: response regulator [Planctomycetes bacterium]|nr:response regulator [Planctomycetota bacterium]